MKRSRSLPFFFALGTVGIAALGNLALAQDPKPGPPPEDTAKITIEKISPQRVLSRQIQGGYDRHQEVFSDLKDTMVRQIGTPAAPAGGRAAGGRAAGAKAAVLAADCLGIYPFDPDAVTDAASKARFEWGAALFVPQNFRLARGVKAKALSVPASEYKVQTLPAIEAAVMYSTVGRAPVDGLKFFSWMAENGYVQVGPTRMVYFTDTTVDLMRATPGQIQDTKTKIIVPIKKRDRNISLKNQ